MFRKLLKAHLEEEGTCLYKGDRTRKIRPNTYVHYWQDGQIERKDVYYVPLHQKHIILEDAFQRYHDQDGWIRL